MDGFNALWQSMGLAQFALGNAWGELLMMVVGGLLIYLAIVRKFEPLLLLPIGFGALLANIPVAGLAESAIEQLIHHGPDAHRIALARLLDVPVEQLSAGLKNAPAAMQQAAAHLATDLGYSNGMLYQFYSVAIGSGIAPLLIFMGVGALTDFSALIARPSTLLLGAAAQFGIFATLLGALALNLLPGFDFTLADASAIAIIGGADGPTGNNRLVIPAGCR